MVFTFVSSLISLMSLSFFFFFFFFKFFLWDYSPNLYMLFFVVLFDSNGWLQIIDLHWRKAINQYPLVMDHTLYTVSFFMYLSIYVQNYNFLFEAFTHKILIEIHWEQLSTLILISSFISFKSPFMLINVFYD